MKAPAPCALHEPGAGRGYAPLAEPGSQAGPACDEGAGEQEAADPPEALSWRWRSSRRLLLAGTLCVAAAVAAAAALLAAGAPPLVGASGAGVGGAGARGVGLKFDGAPFPPGDYQAAMDYLPITTFFDIDTEKSWMPDPIISQLPALLRKFDIRFGLEENLGGWDPVEDMMEDPRTVLCSGQAVFQLLDWLESDDGPIDPSMEVNRTIVFSGTESPMSETFGKDDLERDVTVARVSVFFDRIFYYVTDVSLAGVDTMPLGFTEMYMRDRTDEFLDAYVATRIDDDWKQNHILAAWGVYTTGGGEHYEFGKHPFVDSYGTDSWAWTETANKAIDLRNDAINWIDTPEGQAAHVTRKTVPKELWWMELSKYKFIISPLGTAIQCSKVPEALSMLTIPIVKRGPFLTHDDLLRMGFPIVVVEYWAEVTPMTTEMWWKELSPKLLSFRERCLNTEGYWRLFTQGSCV